MNITNNNLRISFQGKLIPIKDYKGPILKLTKQDKVKIAGIQENITQYSNEIIKMRGICDSLPFCPKFDFYMDKIRELEWQIEKAQLFIEDIKIKRLNKQRAAENKKSLNIKG